jgi:hypothetical protein
MNSSNQAPQVALRCLRRLSRTPITNATISDASTVAELSKTAGKLWTLVAETCNSSGTDAVVQMLPSGMSCTSLKSSKRLLHGSCTCPSTGQVTLAKVYTNMFVAVPQLLYPVAALYSISQHIT